MARALVAMVSELDVRAALRLIQAPTLVLHTTGDRFIPVAHSGYLHAHIDGSRLIEIPGEDHHPTGTSGEHLVEEIVEFLTGNRPAPRCERVLATVVFTDIIGSTARAAELGDQRWRHLLDSHDAVVRAELSRFRGVEIKATGDGTLATFDGPARAIDCACAIRERVTALGTKSAAVFTPEKSNCAARTSAESQSTSVLASPRSAARPRYSSLGPSQTSSRAPAPSSRIAGDMNSRAFPEPGSYMPSREPAVETARRSRDLSGGHRLHGGTAWPHGRDHSEEGPALSM